MTYLDIICELRGKLATLLMDWRRYRQVPPGFVLSLWHNWQLRAGLTERDAQANTNQVRRIMQAMERRYGKS